MKKIIIYSILLAVVMALIALMSFGEILFKNRIHQKITYESVYCSVSDTLIIRRVSEWYHGIYISELNDTLYREYSIEKDTFVLRTSYKDYYRNIRHSEKYGSQSMIDSLKCIEYNTAKYTQKMIKDKAVTLKRKLRKLNNKTCR